MSLLTTAAIPASAAAMLAMSAVGGNMLTNASFETAGPNGPSTTHTGYSALGYSAAADWGVFHNNEGTTTTELVPTGVDDGGSLMLHVKTDGWANGLGQVTGTYDTGPACVIEGAWVYVVSGQVFIGAGNGGNTGPNGWSTTTGQWEWISAENIVCPVNTFIIYSGDVNGAEWYVDLASVEAVECETISGDLNDDGFVDGADLGLLLAAWGPCLDGEPCDADLWPDDHVNGADLGFLLSNWGCE